MSTFGLFGLVIAFAGVAIGSVCLLASQVLRGTRRASSADTFAWAGAVAHILAFVALTFCCGLLVFCFMTGDFSIEYVLLEHSEAEGALGVLYRFAGLWAGREGSLLLWAWLISAFNVAVAVRVMKHDEPIDCMALLVSGLVLVAFVAVMLFSESNMPFTATAAPYIDSSGRLTNTGSMQGMNPLLEHWAQAIHPPTLFIGYAGLTIPFAYAISALIVNDPSKKWVERSSRFAMISWLFLGIGIGLGCVWAYVVLGWGGYWGWDAVENASLLSWCVALALVHSFTVYRKRGAFKRWSIMCACITFAFVITGTFITRSGIVQSVHAFEGDPVSLVLFGGLIAVSMLVGALGLFIRWKSFCPGENDVMESFASRDAAYYFNNVIMIVFTVILCYLTVASALPSWLPFGGQSLSAGTYNAIARPLGVVYCAIIAVCPLLSWVKTDPKTFWKKARIPALCAVVLLVLDLSARRVAGRQVTFAQPEGRGPGRIPEKHRGFRVVALHHHEFFGDARDPGGEARSRDERNGGPGQQSPPAEAAEAAGGVVIQMADPQPLAFVVERAGRVDDSPDDLLPGDESEAPFARTEDMDALFGAALHLHFGPGSVAECVGELRARLRQQPALSGVEPGDIKPETVVCRQLVGCDGLQPRLSGEDRRVAGRKPQVDSFVTHDGRSCVEGDELRFDEGFGGDTERFPRIGNQGAMVEQQAAAFEIVGRGLRLQTLAGCEARGFRRTPCGAFEGEHAADAAGGFDPVPGPFPAEDGDVESLADHPAAVLPVGRTDVEALVAAVDALDAYAA